ncbi:hypothetical protein [Nocardia jejuensis]|uniref:hypothetical protein n=1 Tax=Nocardia jejuensis TaxID=328049 RepID=UPI000A4F0A51|nr:hypothetical protein [Nocardia jejuensis]
MNHADFARYSIGSPQNSAHVDPDVYAASLRARLVFAAIAVVFGFGVVAGLMLGQGSPRQAPSPNVCRAEEVSRIDCVHVTAVPPISVGVPR